MKNTLLIICVLFVSFSCFSQKDSIVSYLDINHKITKVKSEILYIETKVKKESSWLFKEFNRLGKLLKVGHYKDKNKKLPINNHKTFFRGQQLTANVNFNELGDYNGSIQKWFYNGNKNLIGNYINGKKVGVWKYYHMNGNQSLREYYNKGKLVKKVFYDEKGSIITEDNSLSSKKLTYKNGMKSFHKRLSKIHGFVNFQVVGNIYLDFIVDVNGNVSDVAILSNVPKRLKNDISIFLSKISDFFPAVSKNRKLPTHYTYPMNFRVIFNE